MRNSIRNPIAFALSAALAGCAGGGGHTETDATNALACVLSAGLACRSSSSQRTVSSGTATNGSSGSSYAVQTAGAAPIVPMTQPFTRWEEAAAPGVKADEKYINPFGFYKDFYGRSKTYSNGYGFGYAASTIASIGVTNDHNLASASMGGLSGVFELDGRTLPGQDGIVFGGSLLMSGASVPPFESLSRVGIPNNAGSSYWANLGAVADPYRQGWSYQSFGAWDEAGASGAGQMYASSFGAPTPASAVPTTGAATFTGKLAGSYISAAGEGSFAAADLRVAADFGARSLSFASSGTTITRDLATATPAPGLNLAGTLTYFPSSVRFSGTLTNAAGTMQGSSSGRFYGPAAQELGGVFGVAAPGNATPEAFVGGYGAKR